MARLDESQINLGSLKLRLENFRAFSDSGLFRVAPLTCLVGANSSGKSSIISALLVLKQSLSQKAVSGRVSPLALNGPFCELGRFSDVVHGHHATNHISISFGFAFSDLGDFRDRRRSIVDIPIPRATDDYRSRYYFSYYGRETVSLPKRGDVIIRLGFTDDEPFGPSLNAVDITVSDMGSLHCVRTISGSRQQHWRVYVDGLPPRSISQRFNPYSFFPIFRRSESASRIKTDSEKTKVTKFLGAVEMAFLKLTRIISDSDVIGPFRTPPERRYQFGGFSATSGGPTGEQAVDLLITEQLLKIPGHPLRTELSYWLKHLGLARKVSVRDLARKINLFELSLRGVGSVSRSNVADVGFGVSQVLPVLLQGLLIRPGGFYMVQQPEIHLHPDAQAALADYFLFLSHCGVRVIVETHSEYFLLRLRRRLAEGRLVRRDPTAKKAKLGIDDICVLLTTPTKHEGTSVRELSIGDSFQFENLPDGFMNRSVEDRMALLNAVAKSR